MKKSTTKRALLLSVLSMFLCFTMLVGTTFAWFTDEVKSGTNQIVAGNLDVEVYTANGDSVQGIDSLFSKVEKWEPGVVAYENITVVNKGNLALKYQLSVNFSNENTVESNGKNYGLSQILKAAIVEGGVSGNREDVLKQAGEGAFLSEMIKTGELKTQNESKVYGIVIWWEPSADDNNWNVNNDKEVSDYAETGKNELHIDLGVKLVATQLMAEVDSFGPDYDADAILPWDGSADTDWYDASATEYVLYTAEELAGLSQLVSEGNSFSGKTVKLAADINLGNKAWTPIGACDSKAYFQGTFDGQGNTIYNLSVDNSTDDYMYSTSGLFGWVDAAAATVTNVNVDGATVKGSHWVGVIAGYWTGEISNCSVTNATVIGYNVNSEANGDKVGGIVGYMNSGTGKLDGNTVTNSTITGYRDVAGLAGAVATTNTVTNNKVENVVVSYSADYVGEIVSPKTEVTVDATNTATKVTIVKSTTVSTADELATALTSTDKNIQIVLANDVDLPITSLGQQTGGSGEYKLGRENTETITIDLNQHKLNITTNYWSNIGAKNNDAVFTIKNGTMTSSQATGTWNSYDVTFSNCDYVIENVVFEKAIAFANAGKSAELKNVTINETHDYYALWITAEGQNVTIDGLTVNSAGRGIKIDEEYVGTPEKVTLEVSDADFNTVKKAAIMVKSTAGADITLSNVNIENTIDPVHAVWVDEDSKDYYDLVTVDDDKKIWEGKVVSSSAELTAAVAAGKTDLWLLDGE